MHTIQQNFDWKQWHKILFRFFIMLLFLLSQLAYNPFLNVLGYGFRKEIEINANLKGLVFWLDHHIFHIGFLPQQHAIFFSDTHFGVILLLTIILVSLIACMIWTLFDTRRLHYNRLYYWFTIYLSFYIFLAMIPYAIQKIIPIQAHYPTAPELLTRWGDLLNWEVLFRFMGTSPAYCMFCGWLELIASVLILFHRTRVLGCILTAIVLIQVVLLNVFYNNNVILLSGILLLSTIFIMMPALPKLYTILVKLKPVSIAQYKYTFSTRWKKYLTVALFFLPLWKVFVVTKEAWIFYKGTIHNQENQSLYDVAVYEQENEIIPPLTTDTLRWKYVCFLDYTPNKQRMVKIDMQERQTSYRCKWDTLNKKIAFADKDSTRLSYTILANGDMQLIGNWHGKSTRIELAKISIDSLNLVKDKFLFMQEDQD